jgi:hypothetical protein
MYKQGGRGKINQVNVKLSNDMMKDLCSFCEKTGMNFSDVVRLSLYNLFESEYAKSKVKVKGKT